MALQVNTSLLVTPLDGVMVTLEIVGAALEIVILAVPAVPFIRPSDGVTSTLQVSPLAVLFAVSVVFVAPTSNTPFRYH